MDRSEGFPPIAGPKAKVLVLGSLPGRRSIAANQYYAHPRNVFWKIIEDIYGIRGSYAERCDALAGAGIALWDVLQASVRPGSLDADIKLKTAIPNDFDCFFDTHQGLEAVVFNGKKAESLFLKLVTVEPGRLQRVDVMPSTSPAYAAMPYNLKLAAWRTALPTPRQAPGKENR
jgi:double-stranded uracil-DNA glycosylase